jgi:hypothetical protein
MNEKIILSFDYKRKEKEVKLVLTEKCHSVASTSRYEKNMRR